MFRAIVGAMVMATISFSLNLMCTESFVQQIIVGAALISAVCPDTVRVAQEEKRSCLRARQEQENPCTPNISTQYASLGLGPMEHKNDI